MWASLMEEDRALPEYNPRNHEAWAAYFKRQQAEQLASVNNAARIRGYEPWKSWNTVDITQI